MRFVVDNFEAFASVLLQPEATLTEATVSSRLRQETLSPCRRRNAAMTAQLVVWAEANGLPSRFIALVRCLKSRANPPRFEAMDPPPALFGDGANLDNLNINGS